MRTRPAVQHDDERAGTDPAGEEPDAVDLDEHERKS
jgi:hypothetical protein